MTRTIGSCRFPISGIVSFADCPQNITDQFAKVCDSQQRKACLVCKEDSKLRKVCLVCKEDCQEEGLPVFFREEQREVCLVCKEDSKQRGVWFVC